MGQNYVFTKLFDLLYGKTDLGYVIGITIDVFAFIAFSRSFYGGLAAKGALARMMGARDEDE